MNSFCEPAVKPKEEIQDEELIRAHLSGSELAFRQLVERHAPELTSVVERMVKDHHLALDIAQEVFIKLHGLLPRYKFKGRFRSMLYAMAINQARDAFRKKNRSRIVYFEEPRKQGEAEAGRDPFESRDQRALIEEALARVPEPFREALYLRDIAGFSYQEAAEALGCDLGTVKSKINRGRLAFRDRYSALNQEHERRSEGGHHAS
jgi:RNA polymerase sigma-70 factor (ECF subfamily)